MENPTLNEIEEEFDKTIIMAKKEGKWTMLTSSKEEITNDDLFDASAMLIKFTFDLCEKYGNKGSTRIMLDSFSDYIQRLKDSYCSEWLYK